jgi:hypothetical protein
MNLKDLKRPRTDGDPYLGMLTDSAGDTHYELAISGSSKLIQTVFAKSEFEYRIDPKATEKDWAPRYQEMLARHAGNAGDAPQAETIAALRKAPPAAATPKNSIVVSVRRTEGQGTSWMWFWPLFTLPTGANLFFVLPPICFCAGVVIPARGDPGDPDLFLTANGPSGPLIAASLLGPGAIDRVASPRQNQFCWPWEEFVPWFRVNAFTKCTASFIMAGFGVVP